jgi:two-component system phosphate regulon response regulator OmpR
METRTRLLVVDDDPSVRAMLREYLEDHAFVVAEAGSGAQMRECPMPCCWTCDCPVRTG